MITANQWQLERLLVLIRRLTKDDKNGFMIQKALDLFWQLAHSDQICSAKLDLVLSVIVENMKNFCSQRGDSQKNIWLNRCADEFESADNCVLPALRLMREIYCINDAVCTQHMLNRKQVILRLNRDYSFVSLVVNNLTTYMGQVRAKVIEMNNVEPYVLRIDGRYPHETHIKERLNFIKFALHNGQLWLRLEDAEKIWRCLALNAVVSSDRESCFRFFIAVMDEDFEPGCHKQFFENNILQLNADLLTESGMRCFSLFFKGIHHGTFLGKNFVGKDYLWRIITTGNEEIAKETINLLKEVSSVKVQQKNFHELFVGECIEHL